MEINVEKNKAMRIMGTIHIADYNTVTYLGSLDSTLTALLALQLVARQVQLYPGFAEQLDREIHSDHQLTLTRLHYPFTELLL
jgi:hypothetical protein